MARSARAILTLTIAAGILALGLTAASYFKTHPVSVPAALTER